MCAGGQGKIVRHPVGVLAVYVYTEGIADTDRSGAGWTSHQAVFSTSSLAPRSALVLRSRRGQRRAHTRIATIIAAVLFGGLVFGRHRSVSRGHSFPVLSPDGQARVNDAG